MTENELMEKAGRENDFESFGGQLWLERDTVLKFINRYRIRPRWTTRRAYEMAINRIRRKVKNEGARSRTKIWGDLNVDEETVKRKW